MKKKKIIILFLILFTIIASNLAQLILSNEEFQKQTIINSK